VTRRADDRLRPVGADPDLRPRTLHRQDAQLLPFDVEVFAVVRDFLAAPETADDLDRLVEARHARLDVDAERVELVLAVAGADAPDQLAAGDLIERCEVLGECDRVLERRDIDADAEPHVARVRRQVGEDR
jgi:hypothetical protein